MIAYQLEIQARRNPDAIALVFGTQRLSYSALDARAKSLAAALARKGVGHGDRVAALLHNGTAFFEILFACAALGAIFVPLNFRLVAREVGLILDACTPTLLFAGPEFGALINDLRDRDSFPSTVVTVDESGSDASAVTEGAYAHLLANVGDRLPEVPIPADSILMLMHSSGTTGLPKGIMFSHQTSLAGSMAKIIDLGLTPDDTTVVFGPLFHAGPLMDLALPLLLRGGRVVLGVSRHFDPQQLLQTIADQRGTVIPIYPTMLRRVLETTADPALDLECLRLIITGGEAAPIPVILGVHARFPGVAFVNNYGSTEGGPVTTFLAPKHSLRKIGSVGKESFSVDVRIVDQQGRAVQANTVGELVVRSPFVCVGYWKQPLETAAQQRDGWWRTGDLAYRDAEGFLWIAGRSKDMIKSGTENIYPIEVEQVIAALDGVTEVGVIGVPDASWGEAVVAFVVCQNGVTLKDDQVLAHCRTHLASYKKPRHVRFVENLPRGTTNKVAKNVLRAWWEQAAS